MQRPTFKFHGQPQEDQGMNSALRCAEEALVAVKTPPM